MGSGADDPSEDLRVLIVGSNGALSKIWAGHLQRGGLRVRIALDQTQAIAAVQREAYALVILDMGLTGGSALAVADFVSYRQPQSRIIPVTRSTFFSDGSVFQHIPNACAVISEGTSLDDLSAIVEHFGSREEE